MFLHIIRFILAINYVSYLLRPYFWQISKNTYVLMFLFFLTFQLQLLVCGGFCGITWWSSPTSRRSWHRRYLHWKSESSSCTPRIGSNFFQWKSCVSIVYVCTLTGCPMKIHGSFKKHLNLVCLGKTLFFFTNINTSKQSAKGYERMIWEILRRSGYFKSAIVFGT